MATRARPWTVRPARRAGWLGWRCSLNIGRWTTAPGTGSARHSAQASSGRSVTGQGSRQRRRSCRASAEPRRATAGSAARRQPAAGPARSSGSARGCRGWPPGSIDRPAPAEVHGLEERRRQGDGPSGEQQGLLLPRGGPARRPASPPGAPARHAGGARPRPARQERPQVGLVHHQRPHLQARAPFSACRGRRRRWARGRGRAGPRSRSWGGRVPVRVEGAGPEVGAGAQQRRPPRRPGRAAPAGSVATTTPRARPGPPSGPGTLVRAPRAHPRATTPAQGGRRTQPSHSSRRSSGGTQLWAFSTCPEAAAPRVTGRVRRGPRRPTTRGVRPAAAAARSDQGRRTQAGEDRRPVDHDQRRHPAVQRGRDAEEGPPDVAGAVEHGKPAASVGSGQRPAHRDSPTTDPATRGRHGRGWRGSPSRVAQPARVKRELRGHEDPREGARPGGSSRGRSLALRAAHRAAPRTDSAADGLDVGAGIDEIAVEDLGGDGPAWSGRAPGRRSAHRTPRRTRR